MKLALPAGTTSKKIQVVAEDSSSTTGAGLTGLLFNSGGLVAHFIRDGDASAGDITLQTATVGTWTTGGFKEIDSAKLPGLYEFGIPDALLASGADQVIIFIFGATNLVPIRVEIQLKPLPADLKQIDELATNGNNATLFLKQLSIINSSGTALISNSTGGNGDGIHATANGTGAGLHATGAAGAGSSGVKFDSSSSCLIKFAAGGQGILIDGGGADASQGIVIQTGSEAIKCKVDTTATAQTARVVIDATQATTNFDALKILGMGTGAGIHSLGGATGPGALLTSAGSDGLQVTSTGGNGRGLFAAGNGTGAGINASGISAAGAVFTSSASDGLQCTSSGSNGRGLFAAGNGTGAGIHGTSPAAAGALFTSAGSDGLQVTSTGGDGNGINAAGNGAGAGILSTGGNTGDGIKGIGGTMSGVGIHGGGKTSGILGAGLGLGADGIVGTGSGPNAGLHVTGGLSGPGAFFQGGSISGDGIDVSATGGVAAQFISTLGSKTATLVICEMSGGSGVTIIDGTALNSGTGETAGFSLGEITGSGGLGAAFFGTDNAGGNSSEVDLGDGITGNGITVSATSGHGMSLTGAGAGHNGLFVTADSDSGVLFQTTASGSLIAGLKLVGASAGLGVGASGGPGLNATGGAGNSTNVSGPGALIEAGQTGGAGFGQGAAIQGGQGLVLTAFSDIALVIDASFGGTDGIDILGGSGDGVFIEGGTNGIEVIGDAGHGISVAGGGIGNGINVAAGNLGKGLNISGGATSGEAVRIHATLGDAINIQTQTGSAASLFSSAGDGLRVGSGSGGHDIQLTGDGQFVGTRLVFDLNGNVIGAGPGGGPSGLPFGGIGVEAASSSSVTVGGYAPGQDPSTLVNAGLSAGLDAVSITAPTGPATTFRQMVVQLWRRFFKKVVKNNQTQVIQTFADDNTTVVTTQAISSVHNVDTVGPA